MEGMSAAPDKHSAVRSALGLAGWLGLCFSAAWLLAPCLAWVSFAAVLNFTL
jgi:tryptophan-rich sensory protein